ncbi:MULTISPECIES: TorF family putative porin [unclassified Burkholderia]|uniref:TorF family putative porin n=1 Tax=unclassified Burkholderia TaxID=2613784 RepID=UPI00214F8E04|nr:MULTISPECIES: TorF family putative porin [unclassified Burkholderia]MCR4469783.1 TorF family putative porin [Burkholderia sp. SCN-KJ]
MASRFRSIALCAGAARPSARRVRWYASFALLASWFIAAPRLALAASEDWQFEAGIASDKVTRGMDISYHQPSASFAGNWYPGNGFFAGASASTIRWGAPLTTGVEFVANAGYGWRVSGDWTAQAMLSHYQFTRVPSAVRFNYDELVLTAGWRDSVFASVALSPNTGFGPSPSARAISYDLVGRLPLVHGWTATAGIGYYDLHSVIGIGYVYGNVGLTWQFNAWQFDLSYIATNSEAKTTLGPGASNRWIADAIWHF